MRQPSTSGWPAAVVFDADGVLLDTAGHWRAAREALFSRHGRAFGPAENGESVGTGILGTGQALSRLLGDPELAADFGNQLLTLLSRDIVERPPSPLRGAVAIVAELRDHIPIGVASNSPRALLRTSLEGAGLSKAFDVVVGVDDVAEAKPAPDLYLAACSGLGSAPERCLAIEDSPTGTAAARAAGLYVIGMPSVSGCELDADEIVGSLDDPDLRVRLGLPLERPARGGGAWPPDRRRT